MSHSIVAAVYDRRTSSVRPVIAPTKQASLAFSLIALITTALPLSAQTSGSTNAAPATPWHGPVVTPAPDKAPPPAETLNAPMNSASANPVPDPAPAPAMAPSSVAPSLPAHSSSAASSPVSADEDIYDIRPALSSWLWLWISLAALVGVVLLALLLWIVFRPRPFFNPRTAYEMALEKLEAARKLMNVDHPEPYGVAVSDAIRSYLSQRFLSPSDRRTTEEFLRQMEANPAAPLAQHRDLLRDFLQACDLLKFSHYRPTSEELGEVQERAVTFVHATKPAATPTTSPPALPRPAYNICIVTLLFLALTMVQGTAWPLTNYLVPYNPIMPLAENPPAVPAETSDIHHAASAGHVARVIALLKAQPSLIESRNELGMTPLQVAARDGKADVVTLLLADGANLEETTTGNYTALDLAAKNGQKDIVALLLAKGANPESRNSDGDTAATLAEKAGQPSVLALFQAHGIRPAPMFDWVRSDKLISYRRAGWIPDSLSISPDNRRIACGVRDLNELSLRLHGKKFWITINDEEGKHYDGLSKVGPIFSAGSTHVAYVAWQAYQRLVVVDGVEGKPYDDVQAITFSPDGRHVAYVAHRGLSAFAVIDGREGKVYDGVSDLIFSPDSNRVAYAALIGNRSFAVVDGKEQAPVHGVGRITFSPDSKRLAYSAVFNGKAITVVDGNKSPAYDALGTAISFSPDSRRFAYSAQLNNHWFVVTDGQAGKTYSLVSNPIFSPDSHRLAFAEFDGQQYHTVVDGAEGKGYHFIALMAFSPDSRRVAYWARQDNLFRVVLDGVEDTKSYVDANRLVFSPDSSRLAYTGKVGKSWRVVVDGKEGKLYDAVGIPVFSPDSKRIAYAARFSMPALTAGTLAYRMSLIPKDHVIVDATELEPNDLIFTRRGGRIAFDSSSAFHYLAVNGACIYQVDESLKPQLSKASTNLGVVTPAKTP